MNTFVESYTCTKNFVTKMIHIMMQVKLYIIRTNTEMIKSNI